MDIQHLVGREPTRSPEEGPPPGYFWIRIQDDAEADVKPPERILECEIPESFMLGADAGMQPLRVEPAHPIKSERPFVPLPESKLVKVELTGHGSFYVEEAVLSGERGGSLHPEEHVTDGKLNVDGLVEDSYAYVKDGEIRRFYHRIGATTDLKEVS